jgi:signal transduction histidine kinase
MNLIHGSMKAGSSGEHLEWDRLVAGARLLTAASLVAGVWTATWFPHGLTPALVWGYSAFALAACISVRVAPRFRARASVAIHAVDLLTPLLLIICGIDAGFATFTLLFVAIVSAAYRWGVREALATAAGAALLNACRSLATDETSLAHLVASSAALLLPATLFGYLAEENRKQSVEALCIASVAIRRAGVRGGLKRTMSDALSSVLAAFQARKAMLVIHDIENGRLFRWDADRALDAAPGPVRLTELPSDALNLFLSTPASVAWHAAHRNGGGASEIHVIARDAAGTLLPDAPVLPGRFLEEIGPFSQMTAFGMELAGQVNARLFLFDSDARGGTSAAFAFGRRLVDAAAPAVYDSYLLQRLRSRAASIERERVGRELHDGIVQTVMGVQIQMHALSLRSAEEWPDFADELGRLGGVLHEEAIRLRELLQGMKPVTVGPDALVDALADLVQRFERETGIAARFVSKLDRVPLSPRVCGEVVRILQEALVNVRKHSGANHVSVRCSIVSGHCVLSINDDGRGFVFTGRRGLGDLDASKQGPWVIKERLRLLGGKMIVESEPGCGARLEISVPLASHVLCR